MPIDLRLSEDGYYLIYEITEPYDLPELYEVYKQEKIYRDEKPYTMSSIVDMSGLSRIPVNWLTAKSGPGLTHPRSGQILFVGLSRPVHIIVDVIMKVTRYNRMKSFDTREAAEAYMQELVAKVKAEQASKSS